MENASKALIMAGGIIISVLLISVLVYMFSNNATFFDTQKKIEITKELTEFNSKYEIYNRKLLRGTDVISAINQAIDNNKKYEGQDEYKIEVEFEMVESLVYTKNGTKENISFKTGTKYNISDFEKIKNNTDAVTDFKRRIFDCTGITYSKETGRVNKISFLEKELSESGYNNGL